MTSLLLKSSLYKTNKLVIFLMQTNNPFCHWPITHTHTNTHTLDQSNFCLQFIHGLASHVQVWRIMEDFCWWSSMLHNFHPLIWFAENPLSSINLIVENPLSSINLIVENHFHPLIWLRKTHFHPLIWLRKIHFHPLNWLRKTHFHPLIWFAENPLSSINLICGKSTFIR